MRQTQKGAVTQQEHESLDKQVTSIQSRLDRIETLHRVALQITKDLARLRFSCEEFLGSHFSPEEARKQSRKLLQDQLEREKRLTPEIQRLGLF
jgi:surfactin synthase thioesterase subunit